MNDSALALRKPAGQDPAGRQPIEPELADQPLGEAQAEGRSAPTA